MTTQDILAIGCDVLGLKGAARYDDYATMVKTWHDKAEAIPKESDVVAAGTNRLTTEAATVAAEKTDDDAERSNAQSAVAALTNAASQSSFTNAQRDSVIKILCRVAVWLIKRELKR
jgi:exosome complex RNA-binding protein Csl4